MRLWGFIRDLTPLPAHDQGRGRHQYMCVVKSQAGLYVKQYWGWVDKKQYSIGVYGSPWMPVSLSKMVLLVSGIGVILDMEEHRYGRISNNVVYLTIHKCKFFPYL